jgi:AAA domain
LGTVVSLDPQAQLAEFFDYMYGDQTGYVYSPTKSPEGNEFEQYFFNWPTGRSALIEHVLRYSNTHEVYYGPGLLSKPSADKNSFLGTYFVWAEFDGTALQADLQGLPEPTLKIQSSENTHQHWYWRLDNFVQDRNVVESISQRLAYSLGADLSCWNVNRVLRPPGTYHHESENATVVLRWDRSSVSTVRAFGELTEVPVKLLNPDDIKVVPLPLDVIAKYQWAAEDFSFFKEKSIPKGHRSSALTKLGYLCVEMGMDNAETLAILLNADERWKKFQGRRDQKNRLLGIINFCRSRKIKTEVEEAAKPPRFPVFTLSEFRSLERNIEWVIPNFLHKKGVGLVAGPPAVGKTQFSLRMMEALSTGSKFLKWEPVKPQRTLFISMEMADVELDYMLRKMDLQADPDNFLICPVGGSIHMNKLDTRKDLVELIEKWKPDGIVFDSLGKGVGDDINSEKVIFDTFNFIDQIREAFGLFTWFVHHPRKEQIGNKKPDQLSDLYGNTYIGANIRTAINLWPVGSEIEFSCLKLSLAPKFQKFNIRRTDNMNFKISGGKILGETGKKKTDPILSDIGDLI